MKKLLGRSTCHPCPFTCLFFFYFLFFKIQELQMWYFFKLFLIKKLHTWRPTHLSECRVCVDWVNIGLEAKTAKWTILKGLGCNCFC